MRILVIGVTLMLATSVVVPRAHSEPGGETIEAALADRVPEGTRIVDVDYKTFANADAGVGRVSVKGTLLATENRYERVGRPKKDHPILRNEITSLGLSKEEYRKYMGLTGYLGYGIKPNIGRYLNLYKIVATADRSRWNFKGDLRYREDLDGFTFGGDLIALSGESLSRRVQGELAKNIAGNSNSDSFIVGSSAYQKLVDKVISWKKFEHATLKQKLADVFGPFRKGGTFMQGNTPVAAIEAFDFNDLDWEIGYGRDISGEWGETYETRITTALTSLVDRPLRINGFIHLPPGEPRQTEINLRIRFKAPDNNTACIQMYGAGSFPGCYADGRFHVPLGRHGGFYDSETGQSLAIVAGSIPNANSSGAGSGPAASQKGVAQAPSWMHVGETWTGRGTQASGASWDIEITFQPDGSARIAYPSIPCGGVLTPVQLAASGGTFSERITHNRAKCVSSEKVKLATSGPNSLSYFARGGGSTASGRVSRASQGPNAATVDPVQKSAAAQQAAPATGVTMPPSNAPTAGTNDVAAPLQAPRSCILASMAAAPSVEMKVAVSLDSTGRVAGIPRLESPAHADAAVRADFLALTAAIDACAPFPEALRGRDVLVAVGTDGTSTIGEVADDVAGSTDAAPPPSPTTGDEPEPPEASPATASDEASLKLDRQAVRDLQARLLVSGFDPKGVDGLIGSGTRAALRSWQESAGFPPSGYFDEEQRAVLMAESEAALAAWRANPRNERIYSPPQAIALGPLSLVGTWNFRSTCGPESQLGQRTITGQINVNHAGGASYAGAVRQSQGLRGQFTGRLRGREMIASISWGFLFGSVDFAGRIADRELVMRGRDSNGCSFYATKR